MTRARAFVALGSNADGARARLEQALVALEAEGLRVAAVSTPVSSAFVGPDGRALAGAPRVLNAVVEVRTRAGPGEVLERLLAIEAAAGRVRGAGTLRTLDLDLLAHGESVVAGDRLTVPHPRATARAFVLAPWAEIAPEAPVPGTGMDVRRHAARLEARRPDAFADLVREAPLGLGSAGRRPVVLATRADLERWRAGVTGALGLVPTMGALHAGHAALVHRARAASDATLVTIFVNPLQFGPHEDFTRYPRTLEADLGLLATAGADAVWVPDAREVTPDGFASPVVPEGPALGFEGAVRPGHFRGVATVVLQLLLAARPQRAWFGRKDAQQAAVVQRLVGDFGLPVDLEIAPTVRDADGLALSSRNRYLAPAERARARAFPEALAAVARAALDGERDAARLLAPGRARLAEAELAADYLALVDPVAFTSLERLGDAPALVVAAVRAGTTRLLDNRWVVAP